MEELKVTVEHLKNYVDTKLKLEMIDYQSDYVGRKVDLMVGLHQWDRNSKYWSVLTAGGSKPAPDRTRPIVYRLSDLDKEIEHNGERFVPLNELFQMAYESVYGIRFNGLFDKDPMLGQHLAVKAKEVIEAKQWNYGFTVELPNHFLMTVNGSEMTIPNFTMYQKLFKWHFWPFGDEYFEQGLVIDKMTL